MKCPLCKLELELDISTAELRCPTLVTYNYTVSDYKYIFTVLHYKKYNHNVWYYILPYRFNYYIENNETVMTMPDPNEKAYYFDGDLLSIYSPEKLFQRMNLLMVFS